ncbi:hypothetical protein MMC12_001855 [Toensbergia leucococca]|nr:hypothetical protein [Toensbergia leucococca]
MLIAPNDIRSLAAKVVQQCVTLQGGIGGFGTLGITSLAAFVSTGATPWNTRSFPISTRFLTVSVRNTYTRSRQPGRSDPAIALALAQSAPSSVASIPGERLLSASQIWSMQAEGMQRGSIRYWYSNVALAADMTYQCDANLGAPSVVDCTQIEWSQLNPSFSTLAVSPGITTFLHSNTCYLAISAVVSLVITWAQIRTAVSTLINMCIETPYQNTRGGRAYYTASQVIGNPGRRMRRDSDLTGLNALPPGMNVTMFEQKEPWTNPAAELYTCTWEAVSRGSAVSACPSS